MLSFTKPTLVLDESRVRRNIERMAARAGRFGVRFRPHFKTHQSRHIGRIFREFGVEAITVSSIDMASYFAADGWTDILIAFPFNDIELLTRICKQTGRQSPLRLRGLLTHNGRTYGARSYAALVRPLCVRRPR